MADSEPSVLEGELESMPEEDIANLCTGIRRSPHFSKFVLFMEHEHAVGPEYREECFGPKSDCVADVQDFVLFLEKYRNLSWLPSHGLGPLEGKLPSFFAIAIL